LNPLCIAIDGPAGSGKSTLARKLAERLNLRYLDSGASYRAFAAFVLAEGLDPQDESAVLAALSRFHLEVTAEQRVHVNGQDVTDQIRDPRVAEAASEVSAHAFVRARLVEWQRRITARGGIVVEGRDIGTVVLPEAAVKFYITASAQTRAWRRLAQWGEEATPEAVARVREQLEKRDQRDFSREHSPLRPAEDAVLIDTTGQTPEASLARMLEHIERLTGTAARTAPVNQVRS
jgi:CMP/dCMP kinase